MLRSLISTGPARLFGALPARAKWKLHGWKKMFWWALQKIFSIKSPLGMSLTNLILVGAASGQPMLGTTLRSNGLMKSSSVALETNSPSTPIG